MLEKQDLSWPLQFEVLERSFVLVNAPFRLVKSSGVEVTVLTAKCCAVSRCCNFHMICD